MKIGKTRHLKTCEDLGKIMNEDSRGLRRHYKGKNYVPMSKDILYESKHPRRQKKQAFRHGTTLSCAPSMKKFREALIFATFKWKTPVFEPNFWWKLFL